MIDAVCRVTNRTFFPRTNRGKAQRPATRLIDLNSHMAATWLAIGAICLAVCLAYRRGSNHLLLIILLMHNRLPLMYGCRSHLKCSLEAPRSSSVAVTHSGFLCPRFGWQRLRLMPWYGVRTLLRNNRAGLIAAVLHEIGI